MKIREIIEESKRSLQGYKLIEKAVIDLKRDCQYFFKESKDLPMMRGHSYFAKEEVLFSKKQIRQDRNPRSSGHDSFFNWSHNTYFKETFGVNNIRSSSLFVTGSDATARYYGDLYFIFPIGEFDYYWTSFVADSYEDFDFLYKWTRDAGLPREWISEKAFPFFEELIKKNDFSFDALKKSDDPEIRKIQEYIKDEFDAFKYKKNKNLSTGLKSGNEILITYPTEYYAMSGRYLYQVFDINYSEDVSVPYKMLLDLLKK